MTPAARPPGSRTAIEAPLAAGPVERAVERRALPWWRLRTWRKDLDTLTRLRDGLRDMDTESPESDDAAGTAGSTSAPARSAPVLTEAVLTAPVLTEAVLTAPVLTEAVLTAPVLTEAVLTAPVLTGPVPGDTAPGDTAPGDSESAEPRPAEPGQAEPRPAGARSPAGAAAETSVPGPDPAIVAIRATFRHVAAAGDEAVAYFYAWLFLRRPELRELFPPAMDEQRDRLFRALGRIVESLGTPDEMASYLSQLGRDHRKYGVDPGMYDAVGEALIATLRAFAQSAFTPAAETAWTQTFAAAAALMIRAAEDDAVMSPAAWTAEVVQVEKRRHEIAVLTVAPDRVLPYEAGQHLTLQTTRWPHVWRPYSIACRPRDDGLISLHVKAVPGGWVSNALVHHTEPGDDLTLGPALGTMTLQPAQDRDLLCVAGGTGLAPIKAIIEQVVRESASRQRKIFLFYGARKRDDLYDIRELWRLTDAYHGLQLTPVTSDDPAFNGMQGNVGRVAARYMPHSDCEAYVSGPADMVRETIRVLSRAGIERARIHYDDVLLASRPRVGSGT